MNEITGPAQMEWPINNQKPSPCNNTEDSQSSPSAHILEKSPDPQSPAQPIKLTKDDIKSPEQPKIKLQISEKSQIDPNLNDFNDANSSRNIDKSLSSPIADHDPVNSFDSKQMQSFNEDLGPENIDVPEKPIIDKTGDKNTVKDPDFVKFELDKIDKPKINNSLYITDLTIK